MTIRVIAAQDPWNIRCMPFRPQVAFQNFSDLMALIFMNDKCQKLFAMLVWCIWTQRNQIRTQQVHCPTGHLAQLAKDRFDKFDAVQPAAHPRPTPQHVGWKPPPLNAYKVNYYGVVFSASNCSSIGIDRIVVKGDSKIIAEAFETKNLGLVVYGLFVADASVF